MTTVITGEDNIRMASMLALRSALRLEMRGLGRRGRSANQIATQYLKDAGLVAQSKRPNLSTTYRLFNEYLVSLGAEDRPA